MSKDERETKFAGFARLLMNELLGDAGYIDIHKFWDSEEVAVYEQIIAQRAYDLVTHTIDSTFVNLSTGDDRAGALEAVPDLTEWPAQEP